MLKKFDQSRRDAPLNLEQLETFLTVSDAQNFRRAADRLHVSQSTVTVRIQQLEEIIGKSLFSRETRNIELTPSGYSFLPYARKMIDLLQEGIIAARLQGAYAQRLAVGSTNSILEYYLYPLFETFRHQHPDVVFNLVTNHQQNLFQQLADGSLDTVILYNGFLHPDLETIPLESTPLILAGSSQIEAETIDNQNLLEFNYIHLNWGSQFTAWFENQFGKIVLPRLTASHTSLLLRFIMEGKGIGFIPEKIASSFIRSGSLQTMPAALRESPPLLTFHLLHAHKRKQAAIVKSWIDLLTNASGSPAK